MTAIYHVPQPPLNYLPRPDQLKPLVELLLSDRPEAVGVVGVQGMGGIGKSVLAAAAARDERIGRRFSDGIYWIAVGQSPDLVLLQRQLARDLGVPLSEIQFLDAALGRSELENRLAGKAALVVLDDVWKLEHAEQLGVVGPPGRLLITTRDLTVLQAVGASQHCVDLLSLDESLKLLAEWAGQERAELPPEAVEVARECGYLPLALAMVGAMIQRRPTAWPDALVRLKQHDLAKLETRFAGYLYPDLLRAIETSVDGLDDDRLTRRFGPDVRKRYLQLAVFPEDEPIPEAALDVLWGEARLEPADARDLMDELVLRSLAQRFDPLTPGPSSRNTGARGDGGKGTGTDRPNRSEFLTRSIRLHDLQADYLAAACDNLSELHGRFVDAYLARCPNSFATGPNDSYFFQHLAYHLNQSERQAELRDLLLDADWLLARLLATDSAALLGDFRWLEAVDSPLPGPFGEKEKTRGEKSRSLDSELRDLQMLHEAIRLSSHVLADDPWQLAGQLLGRLPVSSYPTLKSLLTHLRQPADRPLLCPVTCTLTPPGTSLLLTLKGHDGEVLAVAVTPDGRWAISASDDQTLRVWDLDTGQALRTLKGHDDWVLAVAVTPDGRRAVSASKDRTLRVWDLETGSTLRILKGHSKSVNAVAAMPDGQRVISVSEDGTVRVWDLDTGETVNQRFLSANAVAVTPDGQRAIFASYTGTIKVWNLDFAQTLILKGHHLSVNAVAVTPDGRYAISGSDDETLRVWDLNASKTKRILKGHYGGILAVAVTQDARLAISASADGTLRVWDVNTGLTLRSLKDRGGWIKTVGVTPDGRRAISSVDRTLRVWRLGLAGTPHAPEGHDFSVTAVGVTPDGRRAISASEDASLRLWDIDTGKLLRVLAGHLAPVRTLTVVPKGRRAVSVSDDGTFIVWDLNTGQAVVEWEEAVEEVGIMGMGRHRECIFALAVTPDGRRAVSACHDHRLHVWDLKTGRTLRRLDGHRLRVNAVAVTPDGKRAISASDDTTLIVWDLNSGQSLQTLMGHSSSVNAVAVMSDGGRAISASSDNTLRVWDFGTGQTIRTFEGHDGPVFATAATPDGRLAISAAEDKTLRLWEMNTGNIVTKFTGDSVMQCCAVGPDGTTIVVGDWFGQVHFLRLIEPQPGQAASNKLRKAKSESREGKHVKKPIRDQVFISYSHEDREWLQRLQKHLKPYIRNATISVWDDTQIKAGAKWRERIAAALASARVGVLLVSPNFLASDFIADKELPPLLEAAEKDGLVIVWLPISASAYKQTAIADLQAAYNPKTPLDSLSLAEQNQAWVDICEKIKDALQ